MKGRLSVTAFVLVSLVLIAKALWLPASNDSVPGLADALEAPVMVQQKHLYRGDADPDTGGVDPRQESTIQMAAGNLLPAVSHLTKKDGSTIMTSFGADGETPASSQEYYAQPDGSGAHLHSAKVFAPDGKAVVGEENYRYDGTTNFILKSLASGNREVTSFYEDGETISSVLTKPGNVELILEERKWSPKDSGHYLLSENIFGVDKIRVISEYDSRHMLLKRRTSGFWDSINGTIIDAWFPGTEKTRLHSETNALSTKAKFYRENGRLDMELTLSTGSLVAVYYDEDGYKPILEKQFVVITWHKDGKWNERYFMSHLSEKRPDGTDARSFNFSVNKETLESEVRTDFVLDGVTYKKGIFTYRIEGTPEEVGTLASVQLTTEKGLEMPAVEHAAKENLRAIIPANELATPDMSDSLPVPPPVPYMYGM